MHSHEQADQDALHQDRRAESVGLPLSRRAGRSADQAWPVLEGDGLATWSVRAEPERPDADGATGHAGDLGCDRPQGSRASWTIRHRRLPISGARSLRRSLGIHGPGGIALKAPFAWRSFEGRNGGRCGPRSALAGCWPTFETTRRGVEDPPFSGERNQRSRHGCVAQSVRRDRVGRGR